MERKITKIPSTPTTCYHWLSRPQSPVQEDLWDCSGVPGFANGWTTTSDEGFSMLPRRRTLFWPVLLFTLITEGIAQSENHTWSSNTATAKGWPGSNWKANQYREVLFTGGIYKGTKLRTTSLHRRWLLTYKGLNSTKEEASVECFVPICHRLNLSVFQNLLLLSPGSCHVNGCHEH